eukprot:10988877-Alexandrium_andersonii.AAC.1
MHWARTQVGNGERNTSSSCRAKRRVENGRLRETDARASTRARRCAERVARGHMWAKANTMRRPLAER